MSRRHIPRKEMRKPKKKKRLSKHAKRRLEEQTVYRHPLFGDIPKIPNGRWRQIDLDFKPKMPTGAVRGNPRKQNFCCSFPHYFYIDRTEVCRQCKQEFVFSAEEQRVWYEEYQFDLASYAVRCRPCRREQRRLKKLNTTLSDATAAVTARPNDPDTLLAYIKAVWRYHQVHNSGNLERAIHFARKLQKLQPDNLDARYWEAACHAAAGHDRKAKEGFETYLAAKEKKHKKYVEHAHAWLAA